MRNGHHFPHYEDRTDFETNGESYYKDLSKKQRLIEELSKKIFEYDTKLNASLEEIKTVLQNYSDILDGKLATFDETVFKLVNEWIEENLEDIFTQATKMVWFGLTDDGHFMAVIPKNWSEIEFDTNEKGQLILNY